MFDSTNVEICHDGESFDVPESLVILPHPECISETRLLVRFSYSNPIRDEIAVIGSHVVRESYRPTSNRRVFELTLRHALPMI
jgi:hypothetical protein